MELWNDYEGKTVDERYRLERLIGPKGRSALFTTTDTTGEPAMIRLIESLNDEGEILRRWRTVSEVRHENLSRVLACDQTVLDGVHLVYAVMEPADAELAEILKDRPLTAEETREMASAVAAGLEALHAHGLVHEHVEPAHVLARGEVIKLRSDLVREAGEGPEAAALRKRDAHDFAVLIQETMTRRREPGGTPLPAPLDEMVRNGRSGAWGVSEMAAVLRPKPGPWTAASGNSGTSTTRATATARPESARAIPGAAAVATGSNGGSVAPTRTAGQTAAAVAPAIAAVGMTANAPAKTSDNGAGRSPAPLLRDRIGTDARLDDDEDEVPHRKGLWAIAALGLLGAILLFWHFLHTGRPPAGAGPVSTAPSSSAAPLPATAPQDTTPAVASTVPAARPNKPSAARTGRERAGSTTAPQRSPVPAAATDSSPATAAVATAASPHDPQSDWRVVAFTYNREEQARHKVDAIAEQHPDLRPEVFSPHGQGPYLVALGGWMSSAEASALRERARSEGLPRDTYTQNFKSR